jgi:hypothetical protein
MSEIPNPSLNYIQKKKRKSEQIELKTNHCKVTLAFRITWSFSFHPLMTKFCILAFFDIWAFDPTA